MKSSRGSSVVNVQTEASTGTEFFRRIVETAEEGVWAIDGKGQTSFVNKKMAEILGYSVEEMLGKDLFDFMDESERRIAEKYIERRRDGVRESHDFIFRRKDGTRVWTSMASSPIADEHQKYRGAIAFVSDISRRRHNETLLFTQKKIFDFLVNGKSLEAALIELLSALESLVEGLIGSILLLDDEGKHLLTGVAPGLPKEYSDAIHGVAIGPNEGSCGRAAFLKELTVVENIQTDPFWKNYKQLAEDNGLRACWSSPIFGHDGKVLGTFAMYFREVRRPTEYDLELVKDATYAAALAIEYVQTRKSLSESEERFRKLSEATSEGVAIHADGKVLLANENLARMSGCEVSDLIGNGILDFAAPETHDRIIENIRTGAEGCYEAIGLRKDGSKYWGELTSRNTSYHGRTVRMTSIRDITDRKLVEEQRDQLLLHERQGRIEAERSNKLRDDFLAIASHELRTPLTPLKLYLQVLTRCFREVTLPSSRNTEMIFNAVAGMDREYNRLNRLISELLDVTRITAGLMVLSRENFDLVELVQDVAGRFSQEFERNGSELVIEAPIEITGFWDRSRLEQVVINLVTNSLKYGGGKPIRIHVTSEQGRACLSVRDHGIGIAKEDQSKIFDRFERAASVEHFSGLGLGLYIVQQILFAHGGSVSVESDLGHGACFTVKLPLNE